MHFVKKVPTTEEEEAVRRKEKAIKQKLFCTIRDKIFEKAEKNEFDDGMLDLTQKLLEKNPDIHTLWIYRRNTIESYLNSRDALRNKEDSADSLELAEQKVENVLNNELHVTQNCFEVNPKSYTTWCHRGWVLKQLANPNIKKELGLCEKALKMDCRNFHVWDHRRVVTKIGNIPKEEEIDFSNKLIGDNFSNYSAWHYRVTLLPRVKDEEAFFNGSYRMDDKTLEEELKKVTSAFYTDPDDQSAWVYTRWLLDISSDKEWMILDSRSPSVPVSITFNGDRTTIVMSKATNEDVVQSFLKSETEGELIAYSGLSNSPKTAKIWHFTGTTPVKLVTNGLDVPNYDCKDGNYINKKFFYLAFGIEPHNTNSAVLKLTENCKELIDLEPQNVWALAMYTYCLIATSPKKEHSRILSNLKKLSEELDVKRKEMYMALASRELLNERLRSVDGNGKMAIDNILNDVNSNFSFRNGQVTSLNGIEYLAGFIKELDISGNSLRDVLDIVLPNLTSLDLGSNKIEKLENCEALHGLKFLSLAACPIVNAQSVTDELRKMSSLERFLFAETNLNGKDQMSQVVACLSTECRLIPHWM
ncbi:unnamed protein product [Auanema sp. JU1783]|nr:unnamed protein product [Auanema sp. JU1783]